MDRSRIILTAFSKRCLINIKMARPKESERQDIKALVLRHSKALFLKQGFANVTMRDIAREIGYSPAAIYLYFDNKDQIYYELFNEGFQILYKRQLETAQQSFNDPIDELYSMGQAYIRFAMDFPEYYDLMFVMREPRKFLEHCLNENTGEPIRTDFSEMSYNLLRATIKKCIDQGYFKGFDVEIASFTTWAAVHGMATLILRGMLVAPEEMKPIIFNGAHECLQALIKTSKQTK